MFLQVPLEKWVDSVTSNHKVFKIQEHSERHFSLPLGNTEVPELPSVPHVDTV